MENTKENGLFKKEIILDMEREFKFGMTEACMKVNGKKIEHQASVD